MRVAGECGGALGSAAGGVALCGSVWCVLYAKGECKIIAVLCCIMLYRQLP